MHSFRQSRPIPSRLRPGVTSDNHHHRYLSTSAPAGSSSSNIMATQVASRYNDVLLSALEQQQQQQPDDSFVFQDPRFLACSEPLVRHASSDQSSLASSSTPASPLLGTASFSSLYTLHAGCGSPGGSPMFSPLHDLPSTSGVASPYSSNQSVGTPYDGNSPRMASDEYPSESSPKGRDYPVVCLWPGCDAKPFRRRADLDRHYKHKHAPASQKDAYHCDYPKCARRRDPFHRRDHFRDHLREFHKEDIEKRGVGVGVGGSGSGSTSSASASGSTSAAVAAPNDEDASSTATASGWWRCAKCLVRNYVEKTGYECPLCRIACQARRRELRRD